MIKPINHEEHQERLDENQAAISHNLLHQISILRAPCMRKWKRNTMESRETRGKVSRQLNYIEFQLGCLQMLNNKSFIGLLIVTVRSFRSTVTMKCPRWIVSEISRSSDLRWRVQMCRLRGVIKRFASCPFDRDRAVEMSPPPFHLSRYNPLN